MPFQSAIVPDRSGTIEARIIPPSLRLSELRLDAGAAHLVILSSGSAEILGEDMHLNLTAGSILWLPAGAAVQLRLKAGSRAARLSATEIGLARAMPVDATAVTLREPLRHILSQDLSEAEIRDISGYLEAIAAENHHQAPGGEGIKASLLTVILIRIWRRALTDIAVSTASPLNVVERFVLLVSQHKRDRWLVDDYAAALGFSRERLGSAIYRATGLSPQAYIHREILSDARDLLLKSSLQVSEISFLLGFQDPGYFNRFFTRHEGISPGRYRRSATGSLSLTSQSYAAWP